MASKETFHTFTVDDAAVPLLGANSRRTSVTIRVRGETPVLVGPQEDATDGAFPILPDETFVDTQGAAAAWWAILENGSSAVKLHLIAGYE